MEKETKKWVQRTIGGQDQANVYIAELAAIMEAVEVTAAMLARPNVWRHAKIYSDSKAALQVIANPKLQSGQRLVRRIHEAIRLSRVQGRDIKISWIPGHYDVAGNEKAHQFARETTEPEATVTPLPWLDGCYKSAVLSRPPDTGLKTRLHRPWTTGQHLRQVDAALPGKHVRVLYDTLTRKEAQTLAQLRTGHSKLRGFLNKIGIEDDSTCECGEGVETVRHFLLHCQRFQNLRAEMMEEAQDRYGDLSYMLGGRSLSRHADGTWLDGPVEKWKPNLGVVKAVIRYAVATGRLNTAQQNAAEGGSNRS
jgi:ribonuclease HI